MGGQGGSSGKVDFPDHMKVAHKDWLDDTGTDNMTSSVVDLMNTAMTGNSPYNGYTPKDPDTAFFASGNTLASYRTPYEMLKCFDVWSIDAAFDTYMTDDLTEITNAVNAHSALMDDEINDSILPKFKAGMVNINATMGSSFVIGLSRMWDTKAKKVSEFDANTRVQRLRDGADVALRRIAALTEWRKIVTHLSGEFARLYLASYFERDESYMSNLRKDTVFDLEMYQYGTAVMACISGATGTTIDQPGQSKLGGAISGAAAGAATGAMIGAAGGPIGALGGAALGLAGSFL